MQVMFSPSSPPPSPPCHSKVSHPYRHISLKAGHVTRASTPSSDAGYPSVTMVTTSSDSNPRLDVVDLTDSPYVSPCSSSIALARSPSLSSLGSNSSTPKASRAGSLNRTHPPPSFSGITTKTLFRSNLAPKCFAPALSTTRTGFPGKRATFLLQGDEHSDREHDFDGEGESAHDDSDDSDRTSFLSAEEFVVPASALRNAVCAGGRILDAKCAQGKRVLTGWQSQGSPLPGPSEPAVKGAQRDAEQNAVHELRRWHALMEVVHTEVGYVRDLRVLVGVYLPLLPSLPLSSSALEAVQGLARDAAKVLELHERFVQGLEGASAEVAGGASAHGSVDKAVEKLASLFVEEASAFDIYQCFCASQPDVVRLLRPAQARTEWAAFERRCQTGGQDTSDHELLPRETESQDQNRMNIRVGSSKGVASCRMPAPLPSQVSKCPSPRPVSRMPSAFKAHALSTPPSQIIDQLNPSGYRRHSYDSFVGVFGSNTLRHKPSVIQPSSDLHAGSTISHNSRLRFNDFLIKPVQRICKYPLMLEGLRSKGRKKSADDVVTTAVEMMRTVAARVDEARQRKETAVKSGLIVERIEPHPVVTAEFLNKLGDCLLASSIDVVHHHHTLNPITTPVRVKYLGGFLYLGGYLLLVKVGKGKTYRVKHWFSLADFEVVDISQDIALVPSSFRLSSLDHHFEIAAACQREKDLWLRAINEARGASPLWNLPSASSLQILQTEASLTPASDGNSTTPMEVPLPIKRGTSLTNINELSNTLALLRLPSTKFRPATSALPHNVKYIFSHTEESSILLHRSSETNRMFVDDGLSDVMSDLVTSLRKQSHGRQERLFPPPQMSDAIVISTKNKLLRRGSVLVARPRGVLVSTTPTTTPMNVDREEDSSVRLKAMATYCKRVTLLPSLNVLCAEPETAGAGREPSTTCGLQFSDTASPFKKVLSPIAITAQHAVDPHGPRSSPLEETNSNPHDHRRARSLVGSVRGLMRFASTRSASSQEASEGWRALDQSEDSASDTGESTATARRRVASAPTSPQPSSTTPMFFPDPDQEGLASSTAPTSSGDQSSLSVTSGLFRKKTTSILLNHDQTLKPKSSFKNFVFYNRLTTVDPA